MSYQGYEPGLYLVVQKSAFKGFDHYGILDIGNRAGWFGMDASIPILLHQTPPAMRVVPFVGLGAWHILEGIEDERAAVIRMHRVLQSPRYHLLGNNCEHVARYIATGKWISAQVAFGVAASVVGAIALFSDAA